MGRRDIVEMLDAIEDENGPVMCDRVLAYLRKAFNWQASRDEQFNSPIVRGMQRTKPRERARQRILDDQEIRDLWTALEDLKTDAPAPFPSLVKTLLLTAQRRDEVASMNWLAGGTDEPAERSTSDALRYQLLEKYREAVASGADEEAARLNDPIAALEGKRWMNVLSRVRRRTGASRASPQRGQ